MPTPTGHYEELDGASIVRFERTFAHPIAEVWAAITDPERLAAWFPTRAEFAVLSPGAPIDFRFPEDAYPPLTGAFREVQAPQQLSFTWGEDVLTFELAEARGGDACRLSLTVVLDAPGKAARDAAGWDSCLDGLTRVLAGRSSQQPAGSASWESYYAHYRAAGLPATAEIPTPDRG